MTYIFIDFEGYKYWIEVNNEGTALRQIIRDEKGMLSISCVDPCLADQFVDVENDCDQITEQEFEKVWHNVTKELQVVWKTEKEKYPIGQKVAGFIKYFYPQGTIIDLPTLQGCANTDNYHGKSLFPNCKISGIVTGYDEKNMWVLIDNCKVV